MPGAPGAQPGLRRRDLPSLGRLGCCAARLRRWNFWQDPHALCVRLPGVAEGEDGLGPRLRGPAKNSALHMGRSRRRALPSSGSLAAARRDSGVGFLRETLTHCVCARASPARPERKIRLALAALDYRDVGVPGAPGAQPGLRRRDLPSLGRLGCCAARLRRWNFWQDPHALCVRLPGVAEGEDGLGPRLRGPAKNSALHMGRSRRRALPSVRECICSRRDSGVGFFSRTLSHRVRSSKLW